MKRWVTLLFVNDKLSVNPIIFTISKLIQDINFLGVNRNHLVLTEPRIDKRTYLNLSTFKMETSWRFYKMEQRFSWQC